MKDNQVEEPIEYFKKIVSHQETSGGESPFLPNVWTRTFGDDFFYLFEQLKSKLVDIDLIQTIKDNPVSLFEIVRPKF